MKPAPVDLPTPSETPLPWTFRSPRGGKVLVFSRYWHQARAIAARRLGTDPDDLVMGRSPYAPRGT